MSSLSSQIGTGAALARSRHNRKSAVDAECGAARRVFRFWF